MLLPLFLNSRKTEFSVSQKMSRGRKRLKPLPDAPPTAERALAAAIVDYLDTFRDGFAYETLDLHPTGDEYPEDREFVRVTAGRVADGKSAISIELLQADEMDDAWLIDALRDLHTAMMLPADDDEDLEQDAGSLRVHVNARLKGAQLVSLISHSEDADFEDADDPPERLRFTAIVKA